MGHSSFKIKGKNATVVTDPFDPEMVGFKYSKTEGDIVTISHDHNDHNRKDLVDGTRFTVNGPGEYEISGVSIIGIRSFHDDKEGSLRGGNTIYIYEMDSLRLAHLGDLGHPLSENQLESIGDVDILMVPVGGEFTIGPKEAAKIVQEIEPYFILPMHYQMPGLNASTFEKLLPPSEFSKEVGLPAETLPKFTIRKEDIILDQPEKVILLERR